jgi:UDPglucose 6-dehydrogenase
LTVEIESPAELVAAKAFRNSFLATKVTFFNQIYDYCKAYNLDYDSVSKAVGADMRIGNSHTQITEERGFGGHCFPKDTKAIVRSAQRNNTRLTLIEESINYNNAVRKDNI